MATQANASGARALAPSGAELLARARALAPAIGEQSATANENCDVSAQIVKQIVDAGLFRVYQPVAWGGYELDPRIVLDLQNAFAEECLSTAWIYGVLAVQSYMLGRFDVRAQEDVWGDDPDTLISSSFAPVGKVETVEDGYRVSGRFTFSSGSSHAAWVVVGGIVASEDKSAPPHMRLFLIPRSDYLIDRVWDTIGLRATGSNDVVMDDVFVPAYRTYAPDPGFAPLPASSGLSDFHRLPWMHMFTTSVANIGVGAGRAALSAFTEVTRTRRGGPTNAASRDNPAFLSVIGRTAAAIDTIDRNAKDNFALLHDCIARDQALPPERALTLRSQLTGSLREVTTLVDQMMLLLGGRGIRRDGPLTPIWMDLMAARAHPGNDPAAIHAQLATTMLDTPS